MLDDEMDRKFWVDKLRCRMPLSLPDVIRQLASDPTVEVDPERIRVTVGNVTDFEWDRIVPFIPLGIELIRK